MSFFDQFRCPGQRYPPAPQPLDQSPTMVYCRPSGAEYYNNVGSLVVDAAPFRTRASQNVCSDFRNSRVSVERDSESASRDGGTHAAVFFISQCTCIPLSRKQHDRLFFGKKKNTVVGRCLFKNRVFFFFFYRFVCHNLSCQSIVVLKRSRDYTTH